MPGVNSIGLRCQCGIGDEQLSSSTWLDTRSIANAKFSMRGNLLVDRINGWRRYPADADHGSSTQRRRAVCMAVRARSVRELS